VCKQWVEPAIRAAVPKALSGIHFSKLTLGTAPLRFEKCEVPLRGSARSARHVREWRVREWRVREQRALECAHPLASHVAEYMLTMAKHGSHRAWASMGEKPRRVPFDGRCARMAT
jgi:hypothetical protein